MNFQLLLSFIFLFFISCEEMPKTVEKESEVLVTIDKVEDETIIEKRIPEKEEIVEPTIEETFYSKTNFGDLKIELQQKEGKILVHSNCDIVEDFSVNIDGKVNTFIETDVNADGFNEFYCVTDKGDLIAYSSYNNKSFGEIYVKQKPITFYENFNGVKFWEVKNKKLLITFSNGADEQLNLVRYSLNKSETGFQLIAN